MNRPRHHHCSRRLLFEALETRAVLSAAPVISIPVIGAADLDIGFPLSTTPPPAASRVEVGTLRPCDVGTLPVVVNLNGQASPPQLNAQLGGALLPLVSDLRLARASSAGDGGIRPLSLASEFASGKRGLETPAFDTIGASGQQSADAQTSENAKVGDGLGREPLIKVVHRDGALRLFGAAL